MAEGLQVQLREMTMCKAMQYCSGSDDGGISRPARTWQHCLQLILAFKTKREYIRNGLSYLEAFSAICNSVSSYQEPKRKKSRPIQVYPSENTIVLQ